MKTKRNYAVALLFAGLLPFALTAKAEQSSSVDEQAAAPVAEKSKPTRNLSKPARPATKAELAKLRVKVGEELKDGDSAKYKDVRIVVSEDGTKNACGYVNSKNSYGGYTGFSKFVAIGLEFPMFETERDKETGVFESVTWKKFCTSSAT